MEPFFHSIQPRHLTDEALDELLALGWFRMQQSVFTCSHLEHEALYRVHWLRFSLAALTEGSGLRRIRRRNQRFGFTIAPVTTIGEAHRDLHGRYRASITFDGAESIESCLFGEMPAGASIFTTHCISVVDGDRLIASGYFDTGVTAAASILHFFDPDYARYSLGKYLILLTLDFLRKNNFAFYYPGYVVAGEPKMNYKLFLGAEAATYFQPETLSWQPFDIRILQH